MLFDTGQKFHIKNADIFIEIDNRYIGSQGIHIKHKDENHYDVYLNGSQMIIPESSLVTLLTAEADKPEIKVVGPPLVNVGEDFESGDELIPPKSIEEVIQEKLVKPEEEKKTWKFWRKKR